MNALPPVSPRPAVARAIPQTPADIDGLRLWLEADYGVEHSGGLVTAWRDRTGRGRDFSASGAGRPTYTSSTGRPCIRTDGAATWMETPDHVDLRSGTTQALTVYAAFLSSQTSTTKAVCGKWLGFGAADDDWIMLTNGTGSQDISMAAVSETGTHTLRTASGGNASTGATVVQAVRYSGTHVYASVDGTTSVGTAIAGAKSGGTAKMHIGRYASTGAGTLGWCAADIFAVLLLNRYLAGGSAEDVFIRDYLRRKWGAP